MALSFFFFETSMTPHLLLFCGTYPFLPYLSTVIFMCTSDFSCWVANSSDGGRGLSHMSLLGPSPESALQQTSGALADDGQMPRGSVGGTAVGKLSSEATLPAGSAAPPPP